MIQNKKSVFKGWNFLKPKLGGMNEAGEYGGVYQSSDGKITALIKKERSSSKNIAEFLGSQIFEAISPGNGAKVNLIAPDDFNKSKSVDSQIYVKSEFFENYSSDMYIDMDKYMSAKTKPSSWFRKDGGRPLFMGSRNKLFRTLENAFKEIKYQNFEKIMPASLLIGDFDVHLGNIGVIRNKKKPKTLPHLVRIDFGGSFDNLTDNIYPHSRIRHLPGFGPTNHFREFPSSLRTKNPHFADSLLAASKIDLSKIIDQSFDKLTKYYSNEAITKFAQRAMPKKFNNKSHEITIEEIKASLIDIMKKRQVSLKEYGLEIKINTLISKKYRFPYYEVKKQELKTLIKEYPDYFAKILNYTKSKNGSLKLKFRDKLTTNFVRILKKFCIRNSVKKHLIKTIESLNEDIKYESNLANSSDKRKNASKTVKTDRYGKSEYVDSLAKFYQAGGMDDIVCVTPSKLGLISKAKQQDQDLLKLDVEDLKQIKNLKEKLMTPIKITESSVILNKKPTLTKIR
ncbi:hypothetical protein [Rickettsia typhi]|uniref:LepB N-terminal domain-containing protein n=2 Tax=Rickettsia typhi TaxID=785 RepID=Q68WJ6_RICTY|nr:hypothetical protein [Rickettsia typhi]AAU03996.1 rickettsial conserved hypothetical protein [Rickettsia typhi str. Wilmington]AFE54375.1 hypothetical protein RTTH1527_02550 [Rickettsia typhi str. TH1527]AFE55213.1 hypothetical protein RTB9991CWPP_02550 [Rickettsia typhi str. B9991CWPP]